MQLFARAYVLKNYSSLAKSIGLNPNELLRLVGIRPDMLHDLENPVPFDSLAKLLHNTARQSGCETIGLRLASKHEIDDFGVISLLIRHQPTLRDALNTFIDYRHILTQSHLLHIDDCGKTTIIREELLSEDIINKRHPIELAVGMAFRLCDELTEKTWRPRSVNFTHTAPEDRTVHGRIFRCKVNFEADFNGIVCDTASLDAPLPSADPAIVRAVSRILGQIPASSQESLVHSVKKLIYLLMPMRRATLEQVALTLGMSVSTLQRRLGDAGTTYMDLLGIVRNELVVPYLSNTGHSLQRISDLLGFANQSSFTRWFIAAFSKTPRSWRKQNNVAMVRVAPHKPLS
jgi:AraC-like DNA-binding protein